MKSEDIQTSGLADVGQRLVTHARQAEFTAKRGAVVELFPYIVAARERMSARAIARFLEKEQGMKLSAVTINKALNDPKHSWNAFFDMIEPSARVYGKMERLRPRDFLFEENVLKPQIQNRLLRAAIKTFVEAEMVQAVQVLREKWFSISLEIRLKARPYIVDRLD